MSNTREASENEEPQDPTIEEHGEAAGLYPEVNGKKRNPLFWKYAGAVALKGWQPGQRVSKEDFDAAVQKADTGLTHR